MNWLWRSGWARLVGAAVVFALTFVLGLLLFFPYESAARFIETRISKVSAANQARGGQGMELRLRNLSPSFPLGVRAGNAQFRLYPATRAKAGTPPLTLHARDLSVNIGLFGLLIGRKTIAIDGDVLGGDVNAQVSLAGDKLASLSLETDNVGVGASRALEHFLGAPGGGKLKTSIRFKQPGGLDSVETEGSITLTEVWLGDGKAELNLPGQADGLTISRLEVEKVAATFGGKDGNIELKSLEVPGPDLTARGRGTLTLGATFAQSLLDLFVSFRVEPGFLERDSRISALLELAAFDPNLQKAKTKDGFLQYQISGTLLPGGTKATPAGATPF